MFDLTPPHLHLLVNHLPIEGGVAALLLLLFAFVRKSAELKRVALMAYVLVGIATFVADSTGGGASHEMRNVPGVQRELIKEHSAAADWAQMIAFGVAAVALVGLILAWKKSDDPSEAKDTMGYIRHHKEPPTWIMIVILLGALLEMSFFTKTAYQGGLIRHPEIQSSFPVPVATDSVKK
jgi:hypothetical protein